MTSEPLPDPDDAVLDELLALSVQLAAAAAERHARGEITGVDLKSSATDPVTAVDRDSEALIVEGIDRERPDDGLLGEEGAERDGTTGLRWVIDPLDGTVNYIHGFPSHAVSIAVEFQDVPVVAVVHDTALGDVYTARRGGGAFCNGEPMRVAEVEDMGSALLGTGFGYDAAVRDRQGRVLGHLISRVADIRRAGSCAVDLASAARGRLDAFYEVGPNRWDVSAGMLLVREAGGIATYDAEARRIMAAPPEVWNDFSQLVADAESAARSR